MNDDREEDGKDVPVYFFDKDGKKTEASFAELEELGDKADKLRSIGERLRFERELLELSQGELAKALGVTPGYISHVEIGKSKLSKAAITKLTKLYGIDAIWLKNGGSLVSSKEQDKIEQSLLLFEVAKQGSVGERIRYARKHIFNCSQSELATKLGVTPTYLSLVESNKSKPSKELLNKIQNIYNINPEWLLKGTGLIVSDPSLEKKTKLVTFLDKCIDFLAPVIYHIEDYLQRHQKTMSPNDKTSMFLLVGKFANEKLHSGKNIDNEAFKKELDMLLDIWLKRWSEGSFAPYKPKD